MRIGVISLLALVLALLQTQPLPEFDAATLKPAQLIQGQPININLGAIRNGRLTMANVTLTDCIKFAYDLMSDAQVVGPDWISAGDTRFEIVGQAPPDTSRDQILLMVRALLAERLKLLAREEKRELPFLALTVAKNGAKMTTVKELAANAESRVGAGRIQNDQMRMASLALLLSRFERQTVFDQTELAGFFKVDLRWTPDQFRGRTTPDGGPLMINGDAMDPNGPSLYTAVQEQLGLRLESRRGPVPVIVVDRAERVPVEN